jgi:hypothetical protein
MSVMSTSSRPHGGSAALERMADAVQPGNAVVVSVPIDVRAARVPGDKDVRPAPRRRSAARSPSRSTTARALDKLATALARAWCSTPA